MSSVYNEIRLALETHFKANWSTTPFTFGNINPVDRAGEDTWVRMSFTLPARSRRLIVGVPTSGQEISGLMTVQIFNRAGQGSGSTDGTTGALDALDTLYNEQRIDVPSKNDIRFTAPQVQKIRVTGGDEDAASGWDQTNVILPFKYLTI